MLDLEPPTTLSFTQELSIRNNLIWFIGSYEFRNLRGLRKLYLANNNIKIIEGDNCFSYTPMVRIFNVNNIDLIDTAKIKAIEKLTAVAYLNLVNCNRTEIPYFPSLLTMNLERNRIITIENGSLNEKILQLGLVKNELTIIRDSYFKNLYSMTDLDLSENKIAVIQPFSFIYLNQLRNLKIQRNFLRELDNRTFAGLSNLRLLHLDENMLKVLDGSMINNLSSLLALHIRFNQIKFIHKGTFQYLPLTEDIRLPFQKIWHLNPYTFSNMPSVIQVTIEGNVLKLQWTKIYNFTFSNLAKLRYLHIYVNQLNQIELLSFFNFSSLLVLDLSDNRPKNLENRQNFILDLKSHLRLNSSRNMIDRIEEGFFKHSNIEELNLNSNRVNKLERGTFEGLYETLTVLRLGRNKLQIVKNFYCKNLFNLRELYLNNNQISVIESGSFANLIYLRVLDLSSNVIFWIDLGLFN